MIVSGTFDITPNPEPPYDSDDNVILGRMSFLKQFQGSLNAKSTVNMTYARTPVESSAGYVAVEKISGSLNDRSGSFVVIHTGVTYGGDLRLTVEIVPDSGTGELVGITGSMTIDNSEGDHKYSLDYQLP